MPKPVDAIQHETYKGLDIRSHQFEVPRDGKTKWKLRLDITFPQGYGASTTCEYLDEEQFSPTQTKAHLAGFEWGRRIVDHWLLTGMIPRQKVSRRLAEAVTNGNLSR